jgi:hypothetical protein
LDEAFQESHAAVVIRAVEEVAVAAQQHLDGSPGLVECPFDLP